MAKTYLFFLSLAFAESMEGQTVYQLTAPGMVEPSFAVISNDGLLIRHAAGGESLYRREARFDEGSHWIGYYSRDSRQALQWPQSNSGPMRIGTLQSDRRWQFQFSRMTIEVSPQLQDWRSSNQPSQSVLPTLLDDQLILPNQTVASGPGQLVPLSFNINQAPVPIQLGFGESSRRRYLSRMSSGGLGLVPQSSLGNRNWYIVPLANGLARVQYVDHGAVLALGCQSNSSLLDLYALADRADQLWRVTPCPGMNGSYALESLLYPGQALTFHDNQLRLAPISYSASQQWWPTTPLIPAVDPCYRSNQQNVIPNPPLPPVQVQLLNSHRETLIVLVADIRPGGALQKLRIPIGSSQWFTMERDSGSTLVESFEVRSGFGRWDRQEFRTAIPPASIYDISVYEEFLQSIAIDRTGSSPNPIEDINYQPRSIGLFVVPPGAALNDHTVLDLYPIAEAQRNSGAVRRLSPKDYDLKTKESDPLHDILREFQGRRAAF